MLGIDLRSPILPVPRLPSPSFSPSLLPSIPTQTSIIILNVHLPKYLDEHGELVALQITS